MENNLYTSKDGRKVYITYFDALYLLNIVFKESKEYAFIDSSHVCLLYTSDAADE